MITGDNLLKVVHVARDVDIVDREVLTLILRKERDWYRNLLLFLMVIKDAIICRFGMANCG
jgi:hypothetical protein